MTSLIFEQGLSGTNDSGVVISDSGLSSYPNYITKNQEEGYYTFKKGFYILETKVNLIDATAGWGEFGIYAYDVDDGTLTNINMVTATPDSDGGPNTQTSILWVDNWNQNLKFQMHYWNIAPSTTTLRITYTIMPLSFTDD